MSATTPLRSLPRVFISGISSDISEESLIDIPPAELDKLRKVLRLGTGDIIAILPNDGSVIRARIEGRQAAPLDVSRPETEAPAPLCIAQALPKGDKLDEIVRACTEIGVSEFIFFPSDRTVVRWDEKKTADRVNRMEIIAREACELSFRTRLPKISVAKNLAEVLRARPDSTVLSEVDSPMKALPAVWKGGTVIVGPEGGWSPGELISIGARGVTLGPRVLRVDHAAAAAAAMLLLSRS